MGSCPKKDSLFMVKVKTAFCILCVYYPLFASQHSLSCDTRLWPSLGGTTRTGWFSTQPRDEGGESKAKLSDGESSCRGKHHAQQKETDNSSGNFGNMMIRTNWSRVRSLSMGHTVVILCVTMIWIQWMSTRCRIHIRSILLELFVHGRHKAFLEVKPILGVCAGWFGA